MKKFIMFFVMIFSFVFVVAAGQYGVIVDVKNVTSNVYAAAGSGVIFKIMSQDDGNTAAARSISLWDTAGNTVFSHGYTIGEQVGDEIFTALTYGGTSPITYSGLPYTTGLTVRTTFPIKIIKK